MGHMVTMVKKMLKISKNKESDVMSYNCKCDILL